MDINLGVTSQDSGKPAAFLNDTYETLKHNPQATQQTLQQGQAAGLAGLGAMAAQRYQNRVNHSQQAQQSAAFGQNPQPTVLEQLQMAAMQGGIMGQLTGNIQMAQAPQAPQGGMGLGDMPVSPATLPQEGMAGGGLVALAAGGYLDADGGDYYDAEQGYADGGMVYDPTESPWDYVKEAGSRLSNAVLPGYEQYRQDLDEEEDEDVADDELAELENYYSTTEPSPAIRRRMEELRGGRNGEVPLAQEAVKNPKVESHKEATKTDKEFKSAMLEDSHLAQGAVDKIKQAALRDNTVDAAQQVEEAKQSAISSGGLPAIQAQRLGAQTEAMPEEAGPTAEEIRDRILALRGGAPSGMSAEEKAWRQEQADTAKTEKWLQTLTAMAAGTFGGGGRTWPEAIGQGALYGLSAYRQGAAAEGEAELGMLQAQSAYAEAQRKAQQDAADKLFGIEAKQMELRSAGQIANQRALIRQIEGEKNRESREKNAAIMAGIRGESEYNDKLAAALTAVEKMKKDIGYLTATPQEQSEMIANIYRGLGISPPGLGGGQGLSGGMGMGNVPVITRAGGLQSPRS